MNMFILDYDVQKSADYHCDKHVIKMFTELLQMLGSVHWYMHGVRSKQDFHINNEVQVDFIWRGFPRASCYKYGYFNHANTVWLRTSKANYDYGLALAKALAATYQLRYHKQHPSLPKLLWFTEKSKQYDFDQLEQTPFVLSMPEQYHKPDTVQSYRAYYIAEKLRFAKWLHSDSPPWLL